MGIECVLNVYKPKGISSYDVVRKVKRLADMKKVGHGGTLDPFAEGVLLVLLGRATKQMSAILEMRKRYLAHLRLGAATQTGDCTAEIRQEAAVPDVETVDFGKLRARFSGRIWQTPPQYSAKKVNGKPAYSYARRGVRVKLEPREITIHDLDIQIIDQQTLSLAVECSSGTYIRVLGEDIAKALGTVGHLVYLKRLCVGDFRWEESISWDQLPDVVHSKINSEIKN